MSLKQNYILKYMYMFRIKKLEYKKTLIKSSTLLWVYYLIPIQPKTKATRINMGSIYIRNTDLKSSRIAKIIRGKNNSNGKFPEA